MVLVNGVFLHCTDKEILVNSSLKTTTKQMARAISKNQVSDPGPPWPSCFFRKASLKLLTGFLSNFTLERSPARVAQW